MSTRRWTRRAVLKILASGSVAGCAGRSSSGPACVVARAGNGPGYCLVEGETLRVRGAAALAPGRLLVMNVDDNTAVVVGRDAGGLYAMSAICTHQCCLLSVCNDATCSAPPGNPGECGQTASFAINPGALICPCHGSRFRADGTVVNGPAVDPLPHFGLRLDGGDLLVDTSTMVAPATRV